MIHWMVLYNRSTGRNAAVIIHNPAEGRLIAKSDDSDVEKVIEMTHLDNYQDVSVIRKRGASAILSETVKADHNSFLDWAVRPLLSNYAVSSRGRSFRNEDVTMERLSYYLSLDGKK